MFLWGCDHGANQVEQAPQTQAPSPAETTAGVNAAFESLAASLALALNERSVRLALKSELEKKYTQAPEVLYRHFKDTRIAEGRSIETVLATGHANLQGVESKSTDGSQKAIEQIRSLVSRTSKMHFAMPVHLPDWNAEQELPLVTYHPVGLDESEHPSFKVEAFDEEGETHLLRVDTENVYRVETGQPLSRPLVVLAVNERTTAEGKVRPAYAPPSAKLGDPPKFKDPGSGGSSGSGCSNAGARESGDMEQLFKVNVSADHEYVTLEPAEISYRIFTHSNTLLKDASYGDPEPQNEWHECTDGDDYSDITENLFRWYWDDYGDYIVVDWYEYDDAGQFTANFDFTFPDQVSISVSYSDNDDNDPMGRAVINKDDPMDDVYDARDIDWVTRSVD